MAGVKQRLFCWWLMAGIFLFGALPSAFCQGTAFFYQGQLGNGGVPANGAYNFTFTLYNAVTNGTPVSGTLTNDNVSVSNGLFTTILDFGPNIFTGQNLWLDIGVSANTTSFTMLSPLQPVLPAPYAIFASSTTNFIGFLPASQIGGTLSATAFAGYTNTVAFTNSANLFSGTFSGNGGSVTNVNVTNLTGVLADAQLPTNTAYLNSNQTFTANNTFNGANTFTNLYGNSFSGSFFGNGLVGWVPVSGTSVQAQIDHGYLLTNSQTVTVTLPATANPGDIVRIAGAGAGGWQLAQNASQSVLGNFLNYNTTWYPSSVGTALWTGMASSAGGTMMAATANGSSGDVDVSVNSGITWAATTASGSGVQWQCIASSADGAYLVAAITNNSIYSSTNAGSSWAVIPTSPSTKGWTGIASSSDGTRVVACAYNAFIYNFVNGVFVRSNATSTTWSTVASSANGNNLVAAAYGGDIYLSGNGGASWTAVSSSPPGSGNWKAVASSADGTKLAAASYNGGIYTSVNSGSSWVKTAAPTGDWSSLACSSDGSKLIAAANSGGIYTSANGGTTWAQETNGLPASASWSCVALSANGTAMAAGVYNGGIYAAQISSQNAVTTTPGTSGYLYGAQGSAVELQYIGNNQFMPVSFSGNIWAY